MEVMRLHGGGSDFEFLDVLRTNVYHLVNVLKGALHQQEFGIGDERAVFLVETRIDDGIGDSGLVFNG